MSPTPSVQIRNVIGTRKGPRMRYVDKDTRRRQLLNLGSGVVLYRGRFVRLTRERLAEVADAVIENTKLKYIEVSNISADTRVKPLQLHQVIALCEAVKQERAARIEKEEERKLFTVNNSEEEAMVVVEKEPAAPEDDASDVEEPTPEGESEIPEEAAVPEVAPEPEAEEPKAENVQPANEDKGTGEELRTEELAAGSDVDALVAIMDEMDAEEAESAPVVEAKPDEPEPAEEPVVEKPKPKRKRKAPARKSSTPRKRSSRAVSSKEKTDT